MQGREKEKKMKRVRKNEKERKKRKKVKNERTISRGMRRDLDQRMLKRIF